MDDLGHHSVHCGRLTPHGMHTALKLAFAYVAQNVPGLQVKVEVTVFAGSGSRMDLVITNPLGQVQQIYVDVTMGTAMGVALYGRLPREGYRLEPGWQSVAGSSARRAETAKIGKYAWRVRAAGAAGFEGPCLEDYGAFGEGARRVLQYIADAAYGPAISGAKGMFLWKAVEHIGVEAAKGVVQAHDQNLRRLHDMNPERQQAIYGGGAGRDLLEGARTAAADPRGPATRHRTAPSSAPPTPPPAPASAPPRPPAPASVASSRRGGRSPTQGGAPSSESRSTHMSLGTSRDGLSLSASLPGMEGRQAPGLLLSQVVEAAG